MSGVDRLVACRVAGAAYAFPIGSVREIIRHAVAQPIASDDSTSLGLVDLRGTAMPVHDLARVLGQEATGTADEQRIVVTAAGEGAPPIGWLVDGVDEVLEIGPEAVEDVGAAGSSIVRRVAHVGEGRLLPLLDVDHLLERAA